MRWLALLAVVSAAWAAGPETVVFDTDSGAFGDDGAALVMLLRSPDRVTVAGVTLTPGNVWPAQGAEYTLHILDLLQPPAGRGLHWRGNSPAAQPRNGGRIQPAVGTARDTPARSRRTRPM